MKKKTPNVQRPTPNIEFERWRITEVFDGKYASKSKSVYDLEDRLLEFAANIVELTESLPNTRAGNHIAGQLFRSGTSSLSNRLRLVGPVKNLGTPANFTVCLNEVEELIRTFVASIRTAERRPNDMRSL